MRGVCQEVGVEVQGSPSTVIYAVDDLLIGVVWRRAPFVAWLEPDFWISYIMQRLCLAFLLESMSLIDTVEAELLDCPILLQKSWLACREQGGVTFSNRALCAGAFETRTGHWFLQNIGLCGHHCCLRCMGGHGSFSKYVDRLLVRFLPIVFVWANNVIGLRKSSL